MTQIRTFLHGTVTYFDRGSRISKLFADTDSEHVKLHDKDVLQFGINANFVDKKHT